MTLSYKLLSKLFQTTITFWCFVFVTLFNLQGAHRSPRRVFIIALGFSFVKSFFQVFSNFFQLFHSPAIRGYRAAALASSSLILPQLVSFVKNFFQVFKLFQVLSLETRRGSAAALASDSIRLPHSIPFVKHFFRAFSNSFVPTGLGGAPHLSACIYYQNIPPLSTPFFNFFHFSTSFSDGHSFTKIQLAERHLL